MGAWADESQSKQQLLADIIMEIRSLTQQAQVLTQQLERSFTTDPEEVEYILTACVSALGFVETVIQRAHSIYMTGSSQVALADAASVLRAATTKLKEIK